MLPTLNSWTEILFNLQVLKLCFIGYAVGNIMSAIWISRALQLPDPRTYGSRNPGVTNVARHGNTAIASLVLLMDCLKGYIPTALSLSNSTHIAFLVGACTIIGHLFPILHRFRGGKAVATFLGVTIALSPKVAMIAMLIWLCSYVYFRNSGLSAIATCIIMPFIISFTALAPLSIPFALVSALVIVMHKKNILDSFKEAYQERRQHSVGTRNE